MSRDMYTRERGKETKREAGSEAVRQRERTGKTVGMVGRQAARAGLMTNLGALMGHRKKRGAGTSGEEGCRYETNIECTASYTD